MSNLPLSRDSFHLARNYICLVLLFLRRKLTDIVFAIDLMILLSTIPYLLSEISIQNQYQNTQNSYLCSVPLFNSGTNCFLT